MTSDPILEALAHLCAAGGSTKRGKKDPSAQAAFAAEGRLPRDALAVQVGNVGVLAQGLSPPQAQSLQAIGTPAPYGQCERR